MCKNIPTTIAKIILKSKKFEIPVDVKPNTKPAGVIIEKRIKIDQALILVKLVFTSSVINATATGN